MKSEWPMQTFSCSGKLGPVSGNSVRVSKWEKEKDPCFSTSKWCPNIQTEKLYVCVCSRPKVTAVGGGSTNTAFSKMTFAGTHHVKISPLFNISCLVSAQKHDMMCSVSFSKTSWSLLKLDAVSKYNGQQVWGMFVTFFKWQRLGHPPFITWISLQIQNHFLYSL